jgi:glycosyltransferase involved in cell wall biosynthesis
MMRVKTVAYDHEIFSLQQYGGVSRYFCEIAARISHEGDYRARIVAPLHYNDHLAASRAPRLGWHLPLRVARAARLYRAANAVLTPPILAGLAPDLLHRTYYTPRPGYARAPLVVTVFDMIHELYPQQFPRGDPMSARKRLSVDAADHVICISYSTARDLEQLWGVPRSKMTVTHLGFSGTFGAVLQEPAAAPARPYLLYVGQRAGYKNFTRLLEAYGASRSLRSEFDLVAFGGSPWSQQESSRIESLDLRPEAVRRLYGSDGELARAYANAFALVYPSEYEGFGIPPLEAMSHGCPVACSNTSSLPEVVGEAAEFFDPKSVDSMRMALERLADDATRRRQLIEAGHAQHQRYSWDRCAQETLAVYRRATAA